MDRTPTLALVAPDRDFVPTRPAPSTKWHVAKAVLLHLLMEAQRQRRMFRPRPPRRARLLASFVRRETAEDVPRLVEVRRAR